MDAFVPWGLFGLILGFMFGVGCASAVLYTIYMGGYRSAVRDALEGGRTERYVTAVRKVKEKMARQAESAPTK